MAALPPGFWCSVLMESLILALYSSERGDGDEAGLEEKWGQVLGSMGKPDFHIQYLQDPLFVKACPLGASQILLGAGGGGLCPRGQNYFHNNTKMLCAFFTYSFRNVEWSFPDYMMCDIATD